MKLKELIQKGSLWIKKTPSKLSICILTMLIYITLAIGNYHQFQESPSQQQAEQVLSILCDVESMLREYNEGQTVKYELKRKGNSVS